MLSAPCVIKTTLLSFNPPFPSSSSYLFFSLNTLTVMKSDCQSHSGQFYYNANNSVKLHPLSLRWHRNQHQRQADTCAHTCLHLRTKVRLLLTWVDGTHTVDAGSGSKHTGLGTKTDKRETWTHTLIVLFSLFDLLSFHKNSAYVGYVATNRRSVQGAHCREPHCQPTAPTADDIATMHHSPEPNLYLYDCFSC